MIETDLPLDELEIAAFWLEQWERPTVVFVTPNMREPASVIVLDIIP
ncbi:MAG: hypothetical protein R3B96_18460 [Pirellulaceae bacterium]